MKQSTRSVLIGVLCLGLGAVGGWFMSDYQRGREQIVASEVADRFLEGRSYKLSQFYGPVVINGANTQRVFSWRSLNMSPSLQLDISPLGDMVCLYELAGSQELRKLHCEEPR